MVSFPFSVCYHLNLSLFRGIQKIVGCWFHSLDFNMTGCFITMSVDFNTTPFKSSYPLDFCRSIGEVVFCGLMTVNNLS